MSEIKPVLPDDKQVRSGLLKKLRDARDQWRVYQQKIQPYQDKVRPYQDKIKKVRVVLYAIAIPWAIYVGIKSLPYYASIGKGESYFKQGLYDQAEKEFQYCYEQCKAENPKDPRLARVLNNLGMLYRGTGRYKLAKPYVNETVEIAEKYFPKKQEYPVSLSNKGALQNDLGEYVESEKTFRKAVEVWKMNVRKDSDTKLASIYNGLARSLREQGKLEEALLTAKKSFAMKESVSGKDSADSAGALENLGKIYQKRGDLKNAQLHLERALTIDKKAFGEKHPDVASDQCSLGRLFTQTGNLKEAKILLENSLSTRKKFFTAQHPTIAKTLASIGDLNLREGLNHEARANLTAALKIQSKCLGDQHPDTRETMDALRNVEQKADD